jgi:hypothetical protein
MIQRKGVVIMPKESMYYRYFPSDIHADRGRVVEAMDRDVAVGQIGDRTLAGWEVRQAYTRGPDGTTYAVVWFVDGAGQGRVWALYVSEGWK